MAQLTTCEQDGSAKAYRCQREEQCDDCWLVDHLKECAGCEHYDHPATVPAHGPGSRCPIDFCSECKRISEEITD